MGTVLTAFRGNRDTRRRPQRGLRAAMCVAAAAGVALACPAVTLGGGVVHDVQQFGFGFFPNTVFVEEGDTIRWHWNDGVHTVTSGEPCVQTPLFNFPLTAAAPLAEWTVPDGSHGVIIPYFCLPHCSFMTGRIFVGVPNPCPADLDFSGVVDVSDLMAMLDRWGRCAAPCAADLDASGEVGMIDLLVMLAAWGRCP